MSESLTNYEKVQDLTKRLYDIEDILKALRDEVGELLLCTTITNITPLYLDGVGVFTLKARILAIKPTDKP